MGANAPAMRFGGNVSNMHIPMSSAAQRLATGYLKPSMTACARLMSSSQASRQQGGQPGLARSFAEQFEFTSSKDVQPEQLQWRGTSTHLPPSEPSTRQNSSGSLSHSSPPATDRPHPPSPNSLSTSELFKEAQIARLSGLCYNTWDELKVGAREEGFSFLAGDDTYFTRWYLAKGRLNGNAYAKGHSQTEASKDAEEELCLFFRGVMWSSTEIKTFRVWQQLSQAWPADILPQHERKLAKQADIRCHQGIAAMASDVYHQIRSHLDDHPGPLRIAGHSLGGSLSQLTAVRLVLKGKRKPSEIKCHTFGSPPVLTPASGGPGSEVLAKLGVPISNFRSWVLDYDPVPRAMLGADPYYRLAMENQVLRGVLAWALGNDSSLERFLYRAVGDTFLLARSTHGEAVFAIPEHLVEERLRMPKDAFSRAAVADSVLRLLQNMLDHSHTSYCHDLLLTARLQAKRERSAHSPAAAAQ